MSHVVAPVRSALFGDSLAVVVVGAHDLTHFVPVPEVVAHLAADPSMFSADRFHPSAAGYRAIAAALAPVLRTAARALRQAP